MNINQLLKAVNHMQNNINKVEYFLILVQELKEKLDEFEIGEIQELLDIENKDN